MKSNLPASRHRRSRPRHRAASPLGLFAVATAVLILVGLGFALRHAGWVPFPSPTPSLAPTTPPTATPVPEPSATPLPPSPSPTAEATATPIPEPSATPRPTPDPSSLDALPNTDTSWSYFRPSPTGAAAPVNISSGRRTLAVRYDAIWQAPGGDAGHVVYLTFDEGYEYKENTTLILDTLAAKGVKAAFFVTGTYVRDNPDLVRRMVAEGHVVGSHTWSHPCLPTLVSTEGLAGMELELSRTQAAFSAATGGGTLLKYLRPPEGHFSERTLAIARMLGYRTVFWSFAYRDWVTTDQPSEEYARDLLLGEIHDGSVILLHAVSTTNATCVGDWIDRIRALGYTFHSLDEIP